MNNFFRWLASSNSARFFTGFNIGVGLFNCVLYIAALPGASGWVIVVNFGAAYICHVASGMLPEYKP